MASKLIALLPGEELNEQKVSAMHPVMTYVVQLTKPAQVCFEVKESNTASRTALYLSQQESSPSAKNASWSCESSKSRKTVVLLPIDERFRVGPCYLSVCYTGTSGVAFFSLRVTMREQYVAKWSFSASMSIYDGMWRLDRRHGQGRCIYYDDPKLFEESVANTKPGSAASAAAAAAGAGNRSLEDAVSAATESIDTQVRLLAQSYLGVGNAAAGNTKRVTAAAAAATGAPPVAEQRGFYAIPDGGSEFYEGEWQDGEKDGEGVYTWPDLRYEGHWRAGQRSGKGVLTVGGTSCVFTGEFRGDAKHGFGVQVYDDGSKYEGMWEDNERHGAGVFTHADGVRVSGTWKKDELLQPVKADFPDNSHYEGEWKDSRMHGRGTLREPDGLIYEGSFFNGKKEGRGTWRLPRGVDFKGVWSGDVRQDRGGEFLFPSTDIYQGEWDTQRHVRSGEGTCVYASGAVYRGRWLNDLRHGPGELRLPSGEEYRGEFLNDKRHGRGACSYADNGGEDDGDFSGEWRDDARHGYGEHRYRDGSSYQGEWYNDHYHGNGRMVNPTDKWEYNGQWKHDARDGMGTVTMFIGTKDDGTDITEQYRGYWKENSRCGEGTIVYEDGSSWTGEWLDNKRADGRGAARYVDGSSYEGAFKSEKRHGKGILTYADGSRYDGEFSHDVPHGEGTLYLVSGDVIQCRFEKGQRVEGAAKCIYANGNVYEGEFKKDPRDGCWKPHGHGMLMYIDYTCFEGTFVYGEYKL